MMLNEIVGGICLIIFIIFLIWIGIMAGKVGGKILQILKWKCMEDGGNYFVSEELSSMAALMKLLYFINSN